MYQIIYSWGFYQITILLAQPTGTRVINPKYLGGAVLNAHIVTGCAHEDLVINISCVCITRMVISIAIYCNSY